ncbi:MAG: chorismate synthase [Microbacterium sp.]
MAHGAADDVDAGYRLGPAGFDAATSALIVAEIDDAKKDGDTLGGIVECSRSVCRPGSGRTCSGTSAWTGQLAQALMSIQAIKGVEVGDGFETTRRRGSAAHDELFATDDGITRSSDRAGGTEGGMSTGTVLRVRAGMKPIATVPHALRTIDVANGEAATAHHQRSDVCAVPAAGVVAEAMVAIVLAEVVLEKFGGDALDETEAQPRATSPRSRSTCRRRPRATPRGATARAIVLIGPMGAGRTSVGRRVARALGTPFADTDKMVVRDHGPIPELFAHHGEGHFRALERAAVAEALTRGGVVALGGGAVLDPSTRERVRDHRVIAPLASATPRRRWADRGAPTGR